MTTIEYADWPRRVAAWIVDQSLLFGPLLVAGVASVALSSRNESGEPEPTAAAMAVAVPLVLGGIALAIWNRVIRDGVTGRSLGRRLTGTRLVGSATGEPIGAGMAFLRQFCHLLDNLPCACLPLGFLWPLWDEKRQTFADKIVGSVVVRER